MKIKYSACSLALTAFMLLGAMAFGLQPTLADHVVTPEEYKQFQEGLRCHREHDFEEALSCWLPLAETGIAEAQYNVGRMYSYGEGVARDYVEGYAWFILSARNGRIEARKAQDELSFPPKTGPLFLEAEGGCDGSETLFG